MDPNETSGRIAEQDEITRQFAAIVVAERWSLIPRDLVEGDIDVDLLRTVRFLALMVLTVVVLTAAFDLLSIASLVVVVASVAISEWRDLIN